MVSKPNIGRKSVLKIGGWTLSWKNKGYIYYSSITFTLGSSQRISNANWNNIVMEYELC